MELLPPMFGLAGLAIAAVLFWIVRRHDVGAEDVARLGARIQSGALVFMRQEYRMLLGFTVIVSLILYVTLGWKSSVACLSGAFCSALAGWLGMYTATCANTRTATAARAEDAPAALRIAFFGGSIMGLSVAALGLLGMGGLFWLFGSDGAAGHNLEGFGLGASAVALFSRVGGGIFTKSADVAADLVGKVEQDIPEDDPRNPGVIADNVGDVVGDVVGMGSDMFESYCGTMIGSIALAATLPAAALADIGPRSVLMTLPLLLPCLGLLSSMVGIVLVGLFARHSPESGLRIGTMSASLLFIGLSFGLIHQLGVNWTVWVAVLIGAAGGMLIGLVTEYYTGGPPVRRIAEAGLTGPATVLIQGLALGLQSVAVPLIGMAAVILVASDLAGLYGVGIAAVGMLATVAITMAIDAYGPIADNAGGMAEMTAMPPEARVITDKLDETGNITAAIGKGFAAGGAALTALALISAFVQTVRLHAPDFSLDLDDPRVLAGIFLGGIVPAVVAAMTMTAVGRAAGKMMHEIRRQFREIDGLLEGRAEPDTDRCIEIATRAALERIVAPVGLAVLTPVLVGLLVGPECLGGMLGGALVVGVLLALMMGNAGGAWDNAKKYVEAGNLGGKGSDAHKANIVGDTVGDPFKDTAGPAMNILIKLMAIVSLVIAPLLV